MIICFKFTFVSSQIYWSELPNFPGFWTHARYYTLGCPKLTVATDHKPLLGIFGDRALDTIDNTRLVRIKQKTLPWSFNLLHVPGKQHVAADGFSRCNQKAELHLLAEIAGHGVRYKIHTLGKQAQVDNLRTYEPSNG